MKNFHKTIFVIGAGAHKPYEMPTSKDLTIKIKELGELGGAVSSFALPQYPGDGIEYECRLDKIKLTNLIKDLKVIEDPQGTSSNAWPLAIGKNIDLFIKEFSSSRAYSIDAFLSQKIYEGRKTDLPKAQQIFPQIGKMIVAYYINKYQEKKHAGYLQFDWIDFILNEYLRDSENLKAFFENSPKIYTFNYDNLFEKILLGHLVSFHGFSIEDGAAMIAKLDITHIYGDIDKIIDSDVGSEAAFYQKCIDRIKVIGEERSEENLDQVSSSFYESCLKARRVYFLGFGFDQLNTNLLFKNFKREKLPSNLLCVSSSMGLEKFDIGQIKRRVPIRITFGDGKGAQIDCLSLIREVYPIFREQLNKGAAKEVKKKNSTIW